jgi:hypothetical protein
MDSVIELYFHICVLLLCISLVSVLYLVPSPKVQIPTYVGISLSNKIIFKL